MATNEQAIITIPKRTHAYNNTPLDSNNGRSSDNPVTPRDVSVTNTGIVMEKKGRVYFQIQITHIDSLYAEVVVRDEFNNLVALVRNSNEGDESSGSYVNNQGVKNIPIPRVSRINGLPSRNFNADGSKTL
jgi:hypothetical protein